MSKPPRFAQLFHVFSILAVLALCQRPLFAAADATYTALRAARPDGRRVAVHGLVLQRDAFRFTFDVVFHYLAPVAGRTVGAVFLGKGSYTLTPASETERHHLALASGDEKLTVLTDPFDAMLLWFTDGTAQELDATPRPRPALRIPPRSRPTRLNSSGNARTSWPTSICESCRIC